MIPKLLTTLRAYALATFRADLRVGVTVAIGLGVAAGLALRLKRRAEPPDQAPPDR